MKIFILFYFYSIFSEVEFPNHPCMAHYTKYEVLAGKVVPLQLQNAKTSALHYSRSDLSALISSLSVNRVRLQNESLMFVFGGTVKPQSFRWRHQWFSTARIRCTSYVAWFGLVQLPFTRIVYSRLLESMQFLTFSMLRLNECIQSWLEKDRKLSRDNCGILRQSQKQENGALLSIVFSGQKTTTMATWQVSEPCFPQNLCTLNCRLSNYQGTHTASKIVWKSYQI